LRLAEERVSEERKILKKDEFFQSFSFFLFLKGGIAFIGLKGIFKIYYKQQQFLRQAHRQIKNYDAGTSSSSTQTATLYTSPITTGSFDSSVQPQTSANITRRYRQDSTQPISSTQSRMNNVNTTPINTATTAASLNIDDLRESIKVESFNFKSSTSLSESDLSTSSSSTSLTNLQTG